jgi:hypothetical protein
LICPDLGVHAELGYDTSLEELVAYHSGVSLSTLPSSPSVSR